MARVHQETLAGLAVFELHPSRIGEIVLARIVDRDRHDFVARGQLAKRLFPAFGAKIRQHDDDRAVAQQLPRIGQRAREVRAAPPWSERHQVANHSQRVSAPFGGPHDVLRHVGEEQRADAVVVPRGSEREDGSDLDGEARLGVGAAEMQ